MTETNSKEIGIETQQAMKDQKTRSQNEIYKSKK